jgi:protein disulfide-isomerase A1
LAPIYEELAKLLAPNTNIIIAKCDATANEVPGVNIRGFPTLKFWKNGSKNAPLDYEGERDLKGLLEYIKKHTTHTWTLDE